MSDQSTPTVPAQHAREESSDVVMLDPDDTIGSPSSYTTASNTTAPAAAEEELPKSVAASPFFRLPREVRQQIYNLSLRTKQAILWPSWTNDAGLAPHLLRVNKYLYTEAAPTLYRNALVFKHPSDANMFLWNHNEDLGRRLTKIYLTVRDRDVRQIWTSYLSSTSPMRSLLNDYPCLESLHVTFHSRYWDLMPGGVEDKFQRWTHDRSLRDLCMALDLKAGECADIKVLVSYMLPQREIVQLCKAFGGELFRVKGGVGEVRTRFVPMQSGKVDVQLELSPIEPFE